MDPLIDLERKSYICITPDNRVRLFSLATGAEKKVYMEKDHLSHRYTCCAWSPVPSPSTQAIGASKLTKDKDKNMGNDGKDPNFQLGVGSQAGKDSALGYFAVGTTSGTIIIWDLERGVVRKSITLTPLEGQEGSSVPQINDIIFSTDAKSIYVATNSATVQKIDWITGNTDGSLKAGKKQITKIDRNPRLPGTILCLSTALRIANFNSDDEKRKIELSEGQIEAEHSKFSSCGRFVACCGRGSSSSGGSKDKNSRNSMSNSSSSKSSKLVIYDLEQNNSESTPLVTVPLEDSPTAVFFRSFSSKATPNYTLLTVFLAMPNGSSCIVKTGYEKASDATSSSSSPTSQDVPQILKFPESANVLCAVFGTANSPKLHSSVTIATGSISKPRFYEVDLNSGINNSESNSNNNIITLEIPGLSSRPKRDFDSTSTVDGTNVADDSKRAKAQSDVNGGDMADMKVDSDANAQTIGQLLNLLSAPSSSRGDEGSSNNSHSKSAGAAGGGMDQLAPTSDSLVTLIVQSLQSGDNTLLEQCLSCEDILVIEESSKRLPTAKVTLFLKRLIAKFEKRPSRGILLTKWLSSILRYHTGYLISIPDLPRQLGGLSQIMEQRLSTYHKLASLGGRLDLLLGTSALGTDRSSMMSNAATSKSVIPLKIYVEE